MGDTGAAMKLLGWLLLLLASAAVTTADYPWTFETNFGGPIWWGHVELEWAMCRDGKQQSPINIDPSHMLFDKALTPIQLERHETPAKLINSGQLPIIRLDKHAESDSSVGSKGSKGKGKSDNGNAVKKDIRPTVAGGPLGAYTYRLYDIVLHFGNKTHQLGSDHSVDGEFFAGEVQLMGFNTLYTNETDAMKNPRGLVAISILVQIQNQPGFGSASELDKLSGLSKEIIFKGASIDVASVFPFMLLPPTDHYVTYDGSLTYPGCHETVTWIIMNKPIFISQQHFKHWTELRRTKRDEEPQLMMENHRPIQETNNRLVRTNIQFRTKPDASCAYKDMYYRRNPHRGRQRKQPLNGGGAAGTDYVKRDSPVQPDAKYDNYNKDSGAKPLIDETDKQST